MKHYVVAAFDAACNAFARPMYVQSPGIAIRSFQDEIKRKEPNNVLSQHPEDFTLHHIANWDDTTAQYEPIQPVVIARGADHREA